VFLDVFLQKAKMYKEAQSCILKAWGFVYKVMTFSILIFCYNMQLVCFAFLGFKRQSIFSYIIKK